MCGSNAELWRTGLLRRSQHHQGECIGSIHERKERGTDEIDVDSKTPSVSIALQTIIIKGIERLHRGKNQSALPCLPSFRVPTRKNPYRRLNLQAVHKRSCSFEGRRTFTA
jgi:hypothetical protein